MAMSGPGQFKYGVRIIICLFGLLTAGLLAQKSQAIWVEVDTVRVFDSNTTPAEARHKTLTLARECAIKKAIPEEVLTSSVFSDLRAESGQQAQEQTAINIFAISTQAGVITEEKILIAKPEILEDLIRYRVRLQAQVAPIIGQRNPALKLDLKINNNVFKSGDRLVITATSTQEGYLYLFNFLADNSVLMMFPNHISMDNSVKARQPLTIPTLAEQKQGVVYKVQADPKRTVTAEAIFGVFCTTPIAEFDRFQALQKGHTIFSAGDESFTRFQRGLAEVPLNQRCETALPIQIFK